MPAKLAARERAWGTRYDTLKLSTPPPSPPPQRLEITTASSIPHSPSSQHNQDDTNVAPTPPTTKPERATHDSSIFIGSLPAHIEHTELTRLLAEHLSEYRQIKGVKVVRDSKGGVCAFAQCEDAATAVHLLNTFQTTPQQPFLGRYLRFEPARAFRTLLISYRTPPPCPYPNSGMDVPFSMSEPSQDSVVDLHTDMRLYRPRNGRYCAVIYDAEAREFETKFSSASPFDDVTATEDPLSGVGLLVSPLEFDGETLHEIAKAFGKVEHFGPFVPSAEGGRGGSSLYPHNAPRSPGMDENVWEVKWEHREDCMNASMTLRNVPHLTVTWAHRQYPDAGNGWESRFGSPTVASSPRFPSQPRSRTQSRSHFSTSGDYPRLMPGNFNNSMAGLRISGSPSHTDGISSPRAAPFVSTLASPNSQGPASPLATRVVASDGLDAPLVQIFSESDFPPLHQKAVASRSRKGGRPQNLSWMYSAVPENDDVFNSCSAMPASPSSSLSVQPSTPSTADALMSPGPDDRHSEYGDPSDAEDDMQLQYGAAQELMIPLTPDFSSPSITPVTPKTMRSFPQTPQSPHGICASADTFSASATEGSFKEGRIHWRNQGAPKKLEPFSIYVGGLDMMGPRPWDEQRVRDIFNKYGEIENIDFIKPVHAVTAFAFVRYTNTESSAAAVRDENGRIYDGNSIRVKIRLVNPPKAAHNRFGKGRNRMYHDFADGTRGQYPAFDQLDDDTRSESTAHLHDVFGRSMTSAETLPQPHPQRFEESSLPVFPSIAAPEFKPQLSEVANRQDASAQDRPVSATSGSVSSAHSSGGHAPPAMGPIHPYSAAPPLPQAWMPPNPYAPYYQMYAPPYMNYAQSPSGYQHGHTVASSAESSSAPHYQWSMMPYQGYRPLPGQIPYQPPSSATGSDSQSQSPSKAPLQPAGFIEGDQGMLIPVYSPDALTQYMSGQPHTHTPPPNGGAQQMPGQAMTGWGTYPPAYGYGYPPHMPYGPPAAHPVVPPGQYPPNGWTPAAPAPYMPPPLPASQSHNPGQSVVPLPNSTSGAITPSASHGGGPGYFMSGSQSQLQFGNGNGHKNAQSHGPRRFTKHHSPGTHLTPSQDHAFRPLGRNDGFRASPPHLSRRGSSGGMDTSRSFSGEGPAHAQMYPASVSQQHLAPHQQHAHMRSSGSYPSAMAPSGSMG